MGSLFDGIGGFPLAAVRNGIRPMWASEIETFPIEVTKLRFPGMIYMGDITKLNGADLPPVDIITGGSPCQDLSVAGARAGLAGARSGLFMEQVRVIKEMKPHNGGNGLGINEDVAFSLTTADRHAVFSRQRVDVFMENEVVCTESARQHKDATDLVIQPPADEEETCILRGANLIRRLTPLECERLQGFPDGWTNIPGASDSARYKALGNSVAIPCVEYVMRGIAIVLRSERRRRVWIVILIVAVESTSAGI